MPFLLRVVTLAMLAALTVAPAVHAVGTNPVADMPYRYDDFDFKYAWKTTQAERGLAVDGLLKNVRYAYVDDVVLTVSVLNKEGKVLVDATTFPLPQQIRMDYYSPFALVLKNVVLSPGDLLRFHVRYRVDENSNQGFNWMSSFTVDAATGAPLVERNKPSDGW